MFMLHQDTYNSVPPKALAILSARSMMGVLAIIRNGYFFRSFFSEKIPEELSRPDDYDGELSLLEAQANFGPRYYYFDSQAFAAIRFVEVVSDEDFNHLHLSRDILRIYKHMFPELKEGREHFFIPEEPWLVVSESYEIPGQQSADRTANLLKMAKHHVLRHIYGVDASD